MQLPDTDAERPVLIAGPTASGKSEIAARLAARQGGVVVNADALQVYDCWRVLTDRPGPDRTAAIPHRLYGHVPGHAPYSVGDWLRDLAPLLEGGARPIVVGGTGLYFTALTEGLAEIPPVPDPVRHRAGRRMAAEGAGALAAELDAESAARIDIANPVRVRRAWEVLAATGQGLAAWRRATPAPLLPLAKAQPFVVTADRDWLAERIATRFDRMLAEGALEEARAARADWDPDRPSAKAIGAPELVAHLAGEIDLEEARARVTAATRRYVKRQQTWMRARMGNWRPLPAA